MSTTLVASIAIAVCLVACGGGGRGQGQPDAAIDAAIGGFISMEDLTPVQLIGCRGFVTCYSNCFASPTATTTKCLATCGMYAKPGAQDRFNAAGACETTWCLSKGVPGGFPYKCVNDNGTLTNLDGSPATAGSVCRTCLDDAQARLYGSSCTNASSDDCKPASCASADQACLDDTP